MNIYVNGDSYTVGSELPDWVLPGFPGYRQYDTLPGNPMAKVSEKTIEWYARRKKVASKYFGSIENYRKAEQDLAWPSGLHKINPKLLVHNGSKSGASMAGITHRTIADLLTHKVKGIMFDRVFIQLTSCQRFEIYDATMPREKFIVDKAVGWADTLPNKTQRELGNCYVAQYKDEDYAIKFLYNLCTLKQAVKGLTGYEPIILSSTLLSTNGVIYPLKNNPDPLIQLLLKESGILDIPSECCMSTVHMDNNFLFCPGLHFEHRTHQEYAKIIYNKYIHNFGL